MSDTYSAVWVSHSSISDFLRCPRAYYLKNVYREPTTNKKMQLMAPPLALGAAVHEVLESLSVLPTPQRFQEPLLARLARVWEKFSGQRGGFFSAEVEQRYKLRGEAMLQRVMRSPGPIAKAAVKMKEDLPHYWLSSEDNLILCGKIDWLEYIPETDSVHIIDFKTSRTEEDSASLQLPIYHLLVHNCQKRRVSAASYWYLELNDDLSPKELPDLAAAHHQVLTVAREIKTARALARYKCPQGESGCPTCRPLERVLAGDAQAVGVNEYGQNVYVLPPTSGVSDEDESVIL